MSKKIFLMAGLITFLGMASLTSCSGSNDQNKRSVPGSDSTKAAYVCPMGDGGHGDAPGKCPKCGMDFVRNDNALK
jgi:hypothetical protein